MLLAFIPSNDSAENSSSADMRMSFFILFYSTIDLNYVCSVLMCTYMEVEIMKMYKFTFAVVAFFCCFPVYSETIYLECYKDDGGKWTKLP